MAWIAFWTVVTASLGASVFALWKGDRPERYGAGLRLAVFLVGMPIQYTLSKLQIPSSVWSPLFDLSTTAIVAFGFLFIAVRYGSNWLAAAMIIQGCEFYTSRIFFDADVHNQMTYAFEENIIATGVALVLFLATLASIRRRARKRLEAAQRAEKNRARLARIEAMVAGDFGALA